jgi:hypothetical protein
VAFVGMALWLLVMLFTKLRTMTAANDDAY